MLLNYPLFFFSCFVCLHSILTLFSFPELYLEESTWIEGRTRRWKRKFGEKERKRNRDSIGCVLSVSSGARTRLGASPLIGETPSVLVPEAQTLGIPPLVHSSQSSHVRLTMRSTIPIVVVSLRRVPSWMHTAFEAGGTPGRQTAIPHTSTDRCIMYYVFCFIICV